MDNNDEELFPALVKPPTPPPEPVLELEDDFDEEEFDEDEPIVPEITAREKIKQDDIFVKPIKRKRFSCK